MKNFVGDEIFWIGIRESDIDNCGTLFKGSITLFGSGQNNNFAYDKINKKRFDYNKDFDKFYSFVNQISKKVIDSFPNCRFMFYDQLDMFYCNDYIFQRSIRFNSKELLRALQDKHNCKNLFKDIVDILPYSILTGSQITYKKAKTLFVGETCFVIQARQSYGGNETFFLRKDNEKDIKRLLADDLPYSITPFKEAIPINIHAIMSKNNFSLFQPSVQIIDSSDNCFFYKGADFALFNQLTEEQKKSVYAFGDKVCGYLMSLGYLGVLGIDLLLSKTGIYFMEINPRFQSSSSLVNSALNKNSLPSLQELALKSLYNPIEVDKVSIYESFYTYLFCKDNKDFLFYIIKNLPFIEEAKIIDDFVDIESLSENSYFFKAVLKFNISSNNNGFKIRLHPNIKKPFKNADFINDYMKLKIALLNHGIRLTDDFIEQKQNFDTNEFGAVSFELIEKNKFITAPVDSKLTQISPFYIKCEATFFDLYYLDNKLGRIGLLEKDCKSDLVTSKGTNYSLIAYKGFDRLKINHTCGCKFENLNIKCKFCDMPKPEREFENAEFIEVINNYKNEKTISHFLIGGGTDSIYSDFNTILFICENLSKLNKSIYAMTIPPADNKIMYKMKESGINEVAFNIECFNEELAKYIMPGKSKNSRIKYFNKLKFAKKIWPEENAVRSMVIIGLDNYQEFLKGIKKLSKYKISPILSIFRATMDTPLENWISFEDDEIYKFYLGAKNICLKMNNALGPICNACQANVVI